MQKFTFRCKNGRKFKKLLEQIDPAAPAFFLQNLMEKQQQRVIEYVEIEFYDSALGISFRWDETPQGHEYWYNIYGKLQLATNLKNCLIFNV